MNRDFVDGAGHHNLRQDLQNAVPDKTGTRQNLLLDSFPADVFGNLRSHLIKRHLPAGTTLYEAGDRISEVCFPITAAVVLRTVLRDGHSIDVAMAGREGAIGVAVGLSSNTATSRAVTLIAGVGYFIAADRFAAIVSGNRAARNMIARYGDVLLLRSQQFACCCSRHNISARLASWLLHCRDCTGEHELPVTHDAVAQSLGVRRTTVTLTMSGLQAAGVIRYRRARIEILDDAALRAAACECYSTVRTQAEAILSLNGRS